MSAVIPHIKIAIHTKTGARYFILNDRAELKDKDTRDWNRCVVYTDNVNVYVRDERDFEQNFTVIA